MKIKLTLLLLSAILSNALNAKSIMDGIPQKWSGDRPYQDLKIITNYPPVSQPNSEASILMIGDTGQEGILPLYSGQVLGKFCEQKKCDFAVHSGDNIYPRGVKDLQDPAFIKLFEDIFSASSLKMPFYMTLGNHDYYSTRFFKTEKGVAAQVEYTTHGDRWRLYSRWYTVLSPQMTLVVLDSNFDFLGPALIKKQKKDIAHFIQNWEKTMAPIPMQQRPWLVFLAHHPQVFSPTNKHEDQLDELWHWYDELACITPKHFFVFGHKHYNEILLRKNVKNCGSSLSVISGGAIHHSVSLKKHPDSLYLFDKTNSVVHLQLSTQNAAFTVHQIDPYPAGTFSLQHSMAWPSPQ